MKSEKLLIFLLIIISAKACSSSKTKLSAPKRILFYTSYFSMKDWLFGFGQKPFENCPVSNCLTTDDRKLLNSITDFDAIFFHIRNMEDGGISLPEDRKNNQFYLMFLMESPLNDNFPYERFQNYFNWTMTYRKDSDFYRPYGWVSPKNWTWHYPKDSAKQNWSQYSANITHSIV